MGLEELQWLGDSMLEWGKPDEDGLWKCHGCDKSIPRGATLNRCGKCKTFCYCDKVCDALNAVKNRLV